MPISEKQQAANRANAAKSTGPRTPEGKARSAQNARTHGFTPMSPDLAGNGDIEITRAQNRNFALADGFHRLARKDNTFPLFLRYKTQTERLYRRAVEEFDRLKRLRPELPKEPISEAQPNENEPPSTPPDEPISNPQPNPEPPASAAPEDRAAKNARQDKSCAPVLHNLDLVGQAVGPAVSPAVLITPTQSSSAGGPDCSPFAHVSAEDLCDG